MQSWRHQRWLMRNGRCPIPWNCRSCCRPGSCRRTLMEGVQTCTYKHDAPSQHRLSTSCSPRPPFTPVEAPQRTSACTVEDEEHHGWQLRSEALGLIPSGYPGIFSFYADFTTSWFTTSSYHQLAVSSHVHWPILRICTYMYMCSVHMPAYTYIHCCMCTFLRCFLCRCRTIFWLCCTWQLLPGHVCHST